MIGLAFKEGINDLREDPMLPTLACLLGKGREELTSRISASGRPTLDPVRSSPAVVSLAVIA